MKLSEEFGVSDKTAKTWARLGKDILEKKEEEVEEPKKVLTPFDEGFER